MLADPVDTTHFLVCHPQDNEIVKLRSRVKELEQSLASKTKEAEMAAQTLAISTMHNGHNGSDSPICNSVSPQSHHHLHNHHQHSGNSQTLPPLRSSMSNKNSTSPRASGAVKPARTAVPRGMVVHSDVPLTMYPAGLTTMQLRVQREDTMSRPTPAVTDHKGKVAMGSALGDIKAMHAHAAGRLPSSSAGHPQAGQMGSPNMRRKMVTRVK